MAGSRSSGAGSPSRKAGGNSSSPTSSKVSPTRITKSTSNRSIGRKIKTENLKQFGILGKLPFEREEGPPSVGLGITFDNPFGDDKAIDNPFGDEKAIEDPFSDYAAIISRLDQGLDVDTEHIAAAMANTELIEREPLAILHLAESRIQEEMEAIREELNRRAKDKTASEAAQAIEEYLHSPPSSIPSTSPKSPRSPTQREKWLRSRMLRDAYWKDLLADHKGFCAQMLTTQGTRDWWTHNRAAWKKHKEKIIEFKHLQDRLKFEWSHDIIANEGSWTVEERNQHIGEWIAKQQANDEALDNELKKLAECELSLQLLASWARHLDLEIRRQKGKYHAIELDPEEERTAFVYENPEEVGDITRRSWWKDHGFSWWLGCALDNLQNASDEWLEIRDQEQMDINVARARIQIEDTEIERIRNYATGESRRLQEQITTYFRHPLREFSEGNLDIIHQRNNEIQIILIDMKTEIGERKDVVVAHKQRVETLTDKVANLEDRAEGAEKLQQLILRVREEIPEKTGAATLSKSFLYFFFQVMYTLSRERKLRDEIDGFIESPNASLYKRSEMTRLFREFLEVKNLLTSFDDIPSGSILSSDIWQQFYLEHIKPYFEDIKVLHEKIVKIHQERDLVPHQIPLPPSPRLPEHLTRSPSDHKPRPPSTVDDSLKSQWGTIKSLEEARKILDTLNVYHIADGDEAVKTPREFISEFFLSPDIALIRAKRDLNPWWIEKVQFLNWVNARLYDEDAIPARDMDAFLLECSNTNKFFKWIPHAAHGQVIQPIITGWDRYSESPISGRRHIRKVKPYPINVDWTRKLETWLERQTINDRFFSPWNHTVSEKEILDEILRRTPVEMRNTIDLENLRYALDYFTAVGKFYSYKRPRGYIPEEQYTQPERLAPDGTKLLQRLANGWTYIDNGRFSPLDKSEKPEWYDAVRAAITDEEGAHLDAMFLKNDFWNSYFNHEVRLYAQYHPVIVRKLKFNITREEFHRFLRWCDTVGQLFAYWRDGKVMRIETGWGPQKQEKRNVRIDLDKNQVQTYKIGSTIGFNQTPGPSASQASLATQEPEEIVEDAPKTHGARGSEVKRKPIGGGKVSFKDEVEKTQENKGTRGSGIKRTPAIKRKPIGKRK